MAEKSKQRAGEVAVGLTTIGFRKSMVFNRFAVMRDPPYAIVHFAFANGAWLFDHFACALANDTLERQRRENLDYLGRLGDLVLPEPPEWQPPMGPGLGPGVVVANMIGLCRNGQEAEIMLHNFSMKALLDLANSGRAQEPLVGDPVALLRSDVELHKHLIRRLYPAA